jgi:sterol desaturase/sphingolipid hydroxylase (fatty acid hydroxylase superfamily)
VLETLGPLQEVLRGMADMVRPFTAQVLARSELYSWLWLTGSLIAIDLLYRVANRPWSESFWSYSTPWRIYTHPSAILDFKFFVVQKLVIALVIAPVLVSALALGRWGSSVLIAWLGPGPAWTAGPGALVAFGVTGLVLFDIGHFISHYIQHKTPFFWEFHKIHHAAEVLTPVTAFRVHPVENILDSLLQGPLQALELAVFYYLYGSEQSLMALVGINAIFPIYYLVDSLRHSHLWISFGPKLEHIFSSPAQHQIHHSRVPQHVDTNFSRYFSFLDWLAGTLYVPKRGEKLDFGLGEGPDPELSDVRSLYWVPMKRAFRLLLPRYAPPGHTSGID